MNTRLAVGTPVTVDTAMYGPHGNDDLVVLAHSDNPDGVGVGPKGNDPAKKHSIRNGWLYYPNSYVTPKEESKEVTTTTAAFKVGDKVAVDMDEPDYTWHATEGIVLEVRGTNSARVEVTKVGPNHTSGRGYTSLKVGDVHTLCALTVIPPFTFADIQVGDTIRRTATFNGATEVREGVVGSKGSYYWANEQGNYILAYNTDGKEGVTLELLNRPEPEPVKADWELAKTGDRLVVEGKETTRILTKQADGLWDTLLIRTWSEPSRGIRRADKEVALAFKDPAFSKNGKYKFFPTK